MDRRRTTFLGSFLVAAAVAACGSSPETRTGLVPDGTDPGAEGAGEPGDDEPTSAPSTTPSPGDKPGCAQSSYKEALPTKASLAGIPFSSTQPSTFVLAALDKRYPIGKKLVEGGLSSDLAASQGSCIDRFLRDKSSAAAVARQLPTVVHECGHFFDLGEASGSSSAYVVRPDLKFTCKGGDATSRGGKTFARSRLKTDEYYAQRKACGGTVKQGCDFYADVYLDGNADDASFQGGDQGYNSVLEEATQYVNSLATALAFEDYYAGTRVSERDGILTFLWYIERYLKLAREEYPAAYQAISSDACWRKATLAVWDRGWFYLDATAGKKNLAMDDAAIEALVKDPTLTREIDALRALECR